MQVKKQQLEQDMEELTGSELGKDYVSAMHRHSVYFTFTQSSAQFSCSVVSDSLRPHGL